MPTLTLRPDGTTQTTIWANTGGADFHTSVSDDLDSSYAENPVSGLGFVIQFTLGASGLAATTRTTVLTTRIRTTRLGSNPQYQVYMHDTVGSIDGPSDVFTVTGGGVITDYAGTARIKAPDGAEWTPGVVDALEVRVLQGSASSNGRLFEVYLDVTYNEAPVVTVDAQIDGDTTAPGVQVTHISTPSVAWQYSDPELDPQERWEVRRYEQPTAGWTGFDPDTTTEVPVETRTATNASTGTTMSVVLENGTTYRDYVRAADTTPVGFAVRYSAWAFGEYTMDLTPPPDPTIVAVADTVGNRVVLTVTEGTGTPTTQYFGVERSDDGGATWTEIRLSPVTNTGGAIIVYDYEAPRSSDGTDQPIVYRARATNTTTAANPISSAAVQSNVVNLLSDGNSWFKSTSDPSLNMVVCITPDGSGPSTIGSESEEPQGVYYAQGAFYPTVHSADIRAERWPTLGIQFDNDAERESFEALRALQEPLLYQSCNGDDGLEQHYVRLGGMRPWRRIVDTTQNTAQVALYSVVATEVEMP